MSVPNLGAVVLDKRFLQKAIRLSIEKMALNEGGPFGAVVVRNDQIVGIGWNRVTAEECPDPTAHAEIVAIRDACRRLNTFELRGCVIYSSCQPCPMCLAAIHWARIEQIYYAASREDAAAAGFDDAHIADELALEMQQSSLPICQALRDDAVVAFKAWERKADRTQY